MRKNLLLLFINILFVLSACGDRGNNDSPNPDGSSKGDCTDTASGMADADYLNMVDEYVNSIRENIEQATIEKNETPKEKTVLFMMNSDTVKISVLADTNNVCTDIYFRNSTPVFMIRNILLDVDSNYLESAYFKNGKIFKCFRDGNEINESAYMLQFEETLGDK